MIVYVSKTANKFGKEDLRVEEHSEHICLNPNYGNVSLEKEVKILMDSGAFQDTSKQKRVTFAQALERQLKLEKKIGKISERIVAYDLIGDLEETVKSNQYLVSRREELAPRQLVLMVQGSTTSEYIKCTKEVVAIANKDDCIGFGGVAWAGKLKNIRGKLVETLYYVLPLLKEKGIKDVHFFGINSFKVLKQIREMEKVLERELGFKNHFNFSCDSSAFEVKVVMGNVLSSETNKWERIEAGAYKDYTGSELVINNIKNGLQIIGEI